MIVNIVNKKLLPVPCIEKVVSSLAKAKKENVELKNA